MEINWKLYCAEAARRLGEITPGDWNYRHLGGGHDRYVVGVGELFESGPGANYILLTARDGVQGRADADFAAHAPTTIRMLLQRVRELEGQGDLDTARDTLNTK